MQITKASFNNITMDITQKVIEQEDRFIFETISSWFDDTYQIKISKKILCRALECFRNEHFEEYTMLLKEMEKSNNRKSR